MSDDLLGRATRALKESGAPSAEELRRTRLRVMESARAAQRKRSRVVFMTLPIAAVLVATTAWAASTGRLGAAVRGLFAPTPVATEAPVVASAPRPQAPPSQQVPVEEPAPMAPEAPPAPVVAPPASTARPPSRPVADAEVEDSNSTDLALYKQAHRLHFNEKSYGPALEAWDDYLRQSPGGAFVIEARYNRAICLVKLGRKAEARVALEPFAAGKIGGGYRRDEAAKLLDALEPAVPQ